MQGLDELLASGGTDFASLGARFGLDPAQTRTALGSLLPAIGGGFQRQADTGGIAPVHAAATAIGEPDVASGNGILGHIFGGKDVSRQVADHAAAQTGLSSTVMKAILPIAAALVAKHFAGQTQAPVGGVGGLLGSIIGGGAGGNPLDAILGGRG